MELSKEKLKSDRDNIRKLSDDLCKIFHNKGFHVLRYDAPHSTYLKLDGGICNSIRISNHKSGKEHLSYKYNIMIDCLDNDYVSKDNKGYLRYYARASSIYKIVDMIVAHREGCLSKYGELNYYKFIFQKLQDGKIHSTLFWTKARTVKCIVYDYIKYENEVWIKPINTRIKNLNKKYKKVR